MDTVQNGSIQDQRWFGHYENGACFMTMMGLEILARSQAGDVEGATSLVVRAMSKWNATRFWGQHYDWCVGDHCEGPSSGFNGPDVLTDTLMLM